MNFNFNENSTAPFASVRWCPNCKEYYAIKHGHQMSCCVMHSPGSCCHYSEILVIVKEAPIEHISL